MLNDSYGALPVDSRPAFVHSSWFRLFAATGVLYVVTGGVVAAATAYVTTQLTAWATAFLVLVGGVAQGALGSAIAWLRPAAPPRLARETWALWNLGALGVLLGQLCGAVLLTDAAGAVLVVALVLMLLAVGSRQYADGARHHRGVVAGFRIVLVLVAVTIPIGLVLAHQG